MFEVIYLKHTTYTTALKKVPQNQGYISKECTHTHKTKPESITMSEGRSYFFLKEQWFILPESIIHIIIILVWHHQ